MDWLADTLLSALANVVLLVAIPLLFYFLFHKLRYKRSFAEVVKRAGLRCGDPRYVLYSLAIAAVLVAILLIWPPPTEVWTREGSAQREFLGLGLTLQAWVMALIYGMIKTGFAEEFLFRGLIAGSLARRMRLIWANLIQALIFLAPHLFLLKVMPEAWAMLPIVFAGALLTGWIRIRSESIVGPWLIHGLLNVAVSLSVAARTAS